MVEHAALILKLAQSEFERLHLQFISCNVVAQRYALFVLCLYIGNKFFGKRNVAVINFHSVRQLNQVEILAESHEALLTAAEGNACLCLLFLKFGKAYARVDGSSGINHLLSLERKTVAEVWLGDAFGIAEIAVGHKHVAVITNRQRSINIRQTPALCL